MKINMIKFIIRMITFIITFIILSDVMIMI
jgi:hypothetical protein